MSGNFWTLTDGRQMLVTFFTSAKTGWKLVQTTPVDTLVSEIGIVRNVNIIIAVIILFCILLFSYLISMGIAKPLKGLRKAMLRAEKGDLEVSIEAGSKDEVGYLAYAFNNMMDEIRQLIVRVRVEEQQKKNAEIKAIC